MKWAVLYSVLFGILFSACEEVYYPKIDKVNNRIVADARIEMDRNDNVIVLSQTQGFYSGNYQYPEVSGARVTLLNDEGNEYVLPEIETGKFHVNVEIQEEQQYKVRIEYDNDIFESEFEKVPGVPKLDTVYGVPTTKTVAPGGSGSSNDFRTVEGVQLYADMLATEQTPNYRFTAERVAEYYWVEEIGDPEDPSNPIVIQILHFYWDKNVIADNFNIAAPPEYSSSKNIIKHPLFYIEQSMDLEPDSVFTGWIVVLHQHGISNAVYNYYNDLNDQLDADGRIFDPVYIQARNNFTCVNNKDDIILGNFEISRKTETRYFISYISKEVGYRIEELSNRSPISWHGETINDPPDFWAQ